MTIREIEMKSGLDRTNIRFYEREGLICPARRENGYRDYSEDDLALLQKIKLLRRLGFSLEAIRSLKEGDTALDAAIGQRLDSIGVQRRELGAAAQVCREMRQDGAVFSTLDAERYLRSFHQALTPPSPVLPTVPESDRIPPARCPWRRYFARSLDLSLASFVSLSLLALVLRVNVPWIPSVMMWLLGLLNWGVLVAVEGLLLSRLGTTPGKWLMGIKLEHADGRRLTFSEAAGRVWQVFGRGVGYTIPIYNLYRHWKSYKAVTEGDGVEWDSDVTLVVQDVAWWRAVVYIAANAVGLALCVIIALIPSMPTHRGGTLTVEQFVENYNQLAVYHGIGNDILLPDGSFQRRDSNVVVMDLTEGDPVVLQFAVEDGILRGISFERDIGSHFSGSLFDSHAKEIATLSIMAYTWADAGLWEAHQSAKHLNGLTYHNSGVWQEAFFGCQASYSVTPLGEHSDEYGLLVNRYETAFHLTRLPGGTR